MGREVCSEQRVGGGARSSGNVKGSDGGGRQTVSRGDVLWGRWRNCEWWVARMCDGGGKRLIGRVQ